MSLIAGLNYALNILNPYATATNQVLQLITATLLTASNRILLSPDSNWIVGLSSAFQVNLVNPNDPTSDNFGLVYLFPVNNLLQPIILSGRGVFGQFTRGLPFF